MPTTAPKTLRLVPSIFPHRPDTILFVSAFDEESDLPCHTTSSTIKAYYKQTITVKILRGVFTASGLIPTKKSHIFSIKYGKVPPQSPTNAFTNTSV
ncbi:hypothetical protein GEMRC1_010705 [Eukaryota sp. GEM-RC1]